MISNSSLVHRTPLVFPVAPCQRQLTRRYPRVELPRSDAERAVQSLLTATAAAAAAMPAVQPSPDSLDLTVPSTLVPSLSSRTRMSSADAMIKRVNQATSATMLCFLGP